MFTRRLKHKFTKLQVEKEKNVVRPMGCTGLVVNKIWGESNLLSNPILEQLISI